MKLSEKTIENLTKIKNELPELAKAIPHIGKEFRSKGFGCYDGLKYEDIVVFKKECNEKGHILGHVARLFDLDNNAYYEWCRFNYAKFCEAILPDLFHKNTRLIYRQNETYSYLFGGFWSGEKFNNLKGFIERVENLLAHGEQVNEFCYKTNKILS